MPYFQPPLSFTSQVDVHPSPQSPSFVHLTFLVTFNQDEDTSGTWEIWTDIPSLDHNGASASDARSWRAIPFEPIVLAGQVLPSQPDGSPEPSPSVLQLKATPLSRPSGEDITRISLTVAIPATAGQVFAYTYRHVLPSGETHWLGGEGSNGVINVSEGTMHGERIGDASWQGEPPKDESVTFEGIAIELKNKAGGAAVHHIPSDEDLSASILILSGSIPLHSTPFYRLSPSALPRPTYLNTPHAVHIAAKSSTLDVKSGQMLPIAAGMDSIQYFNNDGKLSTVVDRALQSAHKDSLFHSARVSADGEQVDDVVALFYSSADSANDIIIYAPLSSAPQQIIVDIPTQFRGEAPLALTASSRSPASYLPEDSSAFNVHIPIGTVAEVVKSHEFIPIISSKSEEPVYICAPSASGNTNVHEQTKEPKNATQVSPTVDAQENVTAAEAVHTANQEHVSAPAPAVPAPDSPMPGLWDDHSPDDSTPNAQPSSASRGSWLLQLIGKFFANLWKWICGIFIGPRTTAAERSNVSQEAEAGNVDDEESEEEVITPPNESTPLLSESAAMSRTTSSTAFSPQTSPSKTITAKSSPALESLVKSFPNTSFPIPPTSQIINYSFTQFTFSQSPPFRFLLPPGKEETVESLRFSMRSSGIKEWQVAHRRVESTPEGSCIELSVESLDEGKIEQNENVWEVKVELK